MTGMKWEINEGKVVRFYTIAQQGARRRGPSPQPSPVPLHHPTTQECATGPEVKTHPQPWAFGSSCPRFPLSSTRG